MRRQHFHMRSAVAGFTLVEALAAMVLMGLVLAALATITGQWLPNWSRGFSRVQRGELLALALDRIVADFGAAEFVPSSRDIRQPLFEGTESSVTFVRSTLGPNTRPGLDIVTIRETSDRQGSALVRSRTVFAPGTPPQRAFADPVILLRAPYRISFSYAGRDGVWRGSWLNANALPRAVRLIVRDSSTGKTLPASTAALIHTQMPAICVSSNSDDDCSDGIDTDPAGKSELSMDGNGQGAQTR
jgi:general secretion pathway protein J